MTTSMTEMASQTAAWSWFVGRGVWPEDNRVEAREPGSLTDLPCTDTSPSWPGWALRLAGPETDNNSFSQPLRSYWETGARSVCFTNYHISTSSQSPLLWSPDTNKHHHHRQSQQDQEKSLAGWWLDWAGGWDWDDASKKLQTVRDPDMDRMVDKLARELERVRTRLGTTM